MSDDENWDCPLCMEEMDIADQNFKPCPCGYQICRFCWNHINENLNGKCPACRRDYKDQTVEFKPLSPAELQRLKNEKRQKDREKKEMEQNNRRHLANMRVVQKNLVYVIGLRNNVNEETLRLNEYFGQYGKILKIVVNRKNLGSYNQVNNQQVVGVYVTFSKKEEAARCINAIDGATFEGRTLRATYGTTKYCSYYLRGLVCQNPNCMYLHEPGVDAESFAKEQEAKQAQNRAAFVSTAVTASEHPTPVEHTHHGLSTPVSHVIQDDVTPASPSALPRTAAWASNTGSAGASANIAKRKISVTSGAVEPSSLNPPVSKSNLPNSAPHTLECSIFDEIYPYGFNDHRKKILLHSEESSTDLINMAPLHRNFFLSRQASEYYHQIMSMAEQQRSIAAGAGGNSVGSKIFAIKPFSNVEKNNNPGASSRFQFAQVDNDLTKRFEKVNIGA